MKVWTSFFVCRCTVFRRCSLLILWSHNILWIHWRSYWKPCSFNVKKISYESHPYHHTLFHWVELQYLFILGLKFRDQNVKLRKWCQVWNILGFYTWHVMLKIIENLIYDHHGMIWIFDQCPWTFHLEEEKAWRKPPPWYRVYGILYLGMTFCRFLFHITGKFYISPGSLLLKRCSQTASLWLVGRSSTLH